VRALFEIQGVEAEEKWVECAFNRETASGCMLMTVDLDYRVLSDSDISIHHQLYFVSNHARPPYFCSRRKLVLNHAV
jgi:hypothetical protein